MIFSKLNKCCPGNLGNERILTIGYMLMTFYIFMYILCLFLQDLDKKESQSLPVIMPGDQIPKYIAWPCPCDWCEPSSPLPTEKITIEVVQVPHPPST